MINKSYHCVNTISKFLITVQYYYSRYIQVHWD